MKKGQNSSMGFGNAQNIFSPMGMTGQIQPPPPTKKLSVAPKLREAEDGTLIQMWISKMVNNREKAT